MRIKKTERKDREDLYERYQNANKDRISIEEAMNRMEEQFKAQQLLVGMNADQIRHSLERLQQIGLKQRPLFSVDYIDLLIDAERQAAEEGYNQRVEQLQNVRQEAVIIGEVVKEGYDPFHCHRKILDSAHAEKKKKNAH